LIPNLPFFLGINYEPWAIEMKTLLWLVDFLHYDHEGCVNFYDKRIGAMSLQLIILAMDENIFSSILSEFSQIPSAKIFWDILEMKKWSENVEVYDVIVVENDDSVEIFVSEIATKNSSIEIAMINEESVFHSKVTCHSKRIPYETLFSDVVISNEIDNGDECVTVDEPMCESLVNLVKFDENYSSHEEWSILMHEKH
jgi:hypothetical protein